MYITRDDLVDRFGQYEIDQLEVNIKKGMLNNDTDPVATAIEDATDKINGFVSTVEELPLPMVPTAIKRVCAVLARYYLYKNKPTEQVRIDYEDEMRWLEQVSSGKVKLILGLEQEKPATGFVSGAMVV